MPDIAVLVIGAFTGPIAKPKITRAAISQGDRGVLLAGCRTAAVITAAA